MKFLLSILFFTFTQCSIAQNANSNSPTHDLENIKGTWVIDLKTAPDQPSYLKEFMIQPEKENKFSGTFYGTEFKNGYFDLNWDVVYFGFSSKDYSNRYFHSGYIKDGKIYGVTYCPGREFTSRWEGKKKVSN